MDRERVAEECLRIEKHHGDVLAYLRGIGCISPWGTWYRIQKEQLGRKSWQISDGKGKKPIIKEEKQKVSKSKRKLTAEEKARAVELYVSGGDPVEYLKSIGIENATQVWGGVRRYCKGVEIPETVPANVETPEEVHYCAAPKKPEPVPFEPEPDEYADMYDPFEDSETAVDETPVTRPLVYMDRTVTAVKNRQFGEFHKNGDWIDWKNLDGQVISMKIEDWKMFFHNTVWDFRILGVELQ